MNEEPPNLFYSTCLLGGASPCSDFLAPGECLFLVDVCLYLPAEKFNNGDEGALHLSCHSTGKGRASAFTLTTRTKISPQWGRVVIFVYHSLRLQCLEEGQEKLDRRWVFTSSVQTVP